MEASFETLIASYIQNNVGIATDFLSVALCEHLAANILTLEANELLQQAGIGNDNKLQQNALVRRDTIYWLDKKHNNIHEDAFFAKIDAFVLYLNQSCYAGITDYEFHYSLYETGDFYKKHLDQFKDNASRQFSMISYLNPNWETQHGGELQIYQTDANQTISPTQGKMVFFKSDQLEHEVLVTNARRMSVTGWLKR
ncbi:2OG-Fe(II) oxygenase [Flavobacterium sp.]|uniref:2OG-Fe(II) oxygenase n=1 Tax=Flavobacterium sp. TaxID=239 RepID=UPI002B91607D|nr:2OG-Fe(II) oxygenase [Flavobacterium sp.]HQA74942.1 2OG-Fe(II) oxygenase family protein [Flavobacterium sp.]